MTKAPNSIGSNPCSHYTTAPLVTNPCAPMKPVQSLHHTNKRRQTLEFEDGSHIYLIVSPMKAVKRFGMKIMLAPRYIGPFPILERCGPVAYKLDLPPSLASVHDIFHVLQLKTA
jgi:hypothetical protein